jgi:hypothetical protein
MKLSLFFVSFAAHFCTSAAEEGSVRGRKLQVSGSIDFNICFSGISTVDVLGKGRTFMKDLQVGDEILTRENQYQPVYGFAHLDKDSKADFLRIETSIPEEAPLEISGNHLLFVQGKANPVRADSIKVGDVLQTGVEGESATITKIATVLRDGIYAPLTPDGELLVNGIKASAYASIQAPNAVEYFMFGQGVSSGLSQQMLSHMAMSPFRMMCMGISSKLCQSFNEDGIPHYASFMLKIQQWVEAQGLNFVVHRFLIALFFVAFGSVHVLELALGPSNAPMIALGAAVCLVVLKMSRITIRAKKLKTV